MESGFRQPQQLHLNLKFEDEMKEKERVAREYGFIGDDFLKKMSKVNGEWMVDGNTPIQEYKKQIDLLYSHDPEPWKN